MPAPAGGGNPPPPPGRPARTGRSTRRAGHPSVSGRVQGVGFRPSVHRLALRHGLAGWVLNASGDVQILVEGRPDAVDAFVACECEGLARVDFFVRDRDGGVVLNELNTMPGFTATSVWAKLFEASGIGYAEALDRLIALALERHERRASPPY